MKKTTNIRFFALLLLMAGFFNSNMMGQPPSCNTSSSDPTSPIGIIPTQEEFPGGDPECGGAGGYRFNQPTGIHVFNDGFGSSITVTVDNSGLCGPVFTWSVTGGIVIDVVYVKGGTDQNIYDYTGEDPRPTTDGYLHSPTNDDNGKYAGLSHVDFCYHYELTASKTANAQFTRTYVWDIEKSCEGDSEITLSEGQVYGYPFSWTVNAIGYDTDHKVTGAITIENNTPFAASITSVSDVLSGGEVATVNCGIGFPYVLAAGATLNCTYTVNVDPPYDGINTVTVATSTANVEGDVATAPFAFGNPTTKVDGCVTVTDDCTTTTEVCADDAPFTLEYTCPISYDVCGEYTYTNKAGFTTSNTGTTGSHNCTVSVNVPCGGGCTHTIGYWKTHSINGPAPYDDTWALVGENTSFFMSGKTWYQAAWTSPAGNAYYILAHQYIAARLNFLDGASVPSAVQTAFDAATVLFNTYTPAQIGALNGGNPLRKQFIALATILDDYNNGLTGPGHCSEENNGVSKQKQEASVSRSAASTPTGDFSIYPNPAGSEVQINLSGFEGQQADLEIFNQLGARVWTRSFDEVNTPLLTLTLDNGAFTNGIYIVVVTSGDQRVAKKLVVQSNK